MEVLQVIGGFILALIMFGIKNWADIKASRKAIRKLVETVENAREDDKYTDKEKSQIAEQAIKTLETVIPVLASVWKFNWRKKRKIDEVINSNS